VLLNLYTWLTEQAVNNLVEFNAFKNYEAHSIAETEPMPNYNPTHKQQGSNLLFI
jgi:hypothetical protein